MIHEMLSTYKLVLASASPRRRELFSLLGLNTTVFPADIAEPMTDEEPQIQAMKHARNKAMFVKEQVPDNSIVVAADTLVAVDKHVLGKPKDADEARAFLRLLASKDHAVYTGICICLDDRIICDYERTSVSFAALTETEIDSYLTTGEPFDKAGAYGIQGYGAQFITKVNGCYFNVMGFPIRKFYDMLNELLVGAML